MDWIAIEVKFQNATNFTTVQTLLRNILGLGKRNLFVKALCAGAGGAATDYRFSIQNPKRWSQVHAVLEQLNAKKPFSALPKIVGIEIALDAFNRDNYSYDALVDLVANYCFYLSMPASQNRRLNGLPGSVRGDHTRDLVCRLISQRRPLVIGNNDTDEWSQRIYVKTVDNAGKDTLPESEHRARFENTFRGANLSSFELGDWKNFQFQQYSKYFHCRQQRKFDTPLMTIVEAANTRAGERRIRPHRTNGKVDGTRLFAPGSNADIQLNKKIYDALRGLANRWKL